MYGQYVHFRIQAIAFVVSLEMFLQITLHFAEIISIFKNKKYNMKKVLLVALAAVLFTACQKESTTTLGSSVKDNLATELTAMKDKLTKSSDITVIDMSVPTTKSIKPPVTCSPIPVAVGASIAHDTVLIKHTDIIGVVDAYISYQFYWGGYVGQAKMSVQTRYYENNDPNTPVDSKIKYFTVSSTLGATDHGVFVATGLKMPVNTVIEFTVKGYNNCGDTTTLTLLYSFGYNNTAKISSGDKAQAIDWLNKVTTMGKEIDAP
jgi:hypothetical protein